MLLSSPVQGLDYAVRREAKHSSMDGDMIAKVAAESMGEGFRASKGFLALGARHPPEHIPLRSQASIPTFP